VASGSEPVGFAHQMQGNLEASTVEFRTTSQGIHPSLVMLYEEGLGLRCKQHFCEDVSDSYFDIFHV
jgi:hypothetical protein